LLSKYLTKSNPIALLSKYLTFLGLKAKNEGKNMKFKVGDKVKITKCFLSQLSFSAANKIKDGGVITKIYSKEAKVNFRSGNTYNIFFTHLELELTKNQQLLFDFME